MKILVIEDNKIDQDIIKMSIKFATNQNKFKTTPEVDYVTNIHDALEYLSYSSYDVIITDLTLPDSKGTPTISTLRNSTEKPIIIISGAYIINALEKAMDGGSAKYIIKGDHWTSEIAPMIQRVIRDDIISKEVQGKINDLGGINTFK